jgi:hypothetical protein
MKSISACSVVDGFESAMVALQARPQPALWCSVGQISRKFWKLARPAAEYVPSLQENEYRVASFLASAAA